MRQLVQRASFTPTKWFAALFGTRCSGCRGSPTRPYSIHWFCLQQSSYRARNVHCLVIARTDSGGTSYGRLFLPVSRSSK
jgi:hypothetical protein